MAGSSLPPITSATLALKSQQVGEALQKRLPKRLDRVTESVSVPNREPPEGRTTFGGLSKFVQGASTPVIAPNVEGWDPQNPGRAVVLSERMQGGAALAGQVLKNIHRQ